MKSLSKILNTVIAGDCLKEMKRIPAWLKTGIHMRVNLNKFLRAV